MRRWGLFGGTFDPPHVGHLALAEWAREALGLERVVFMPAGRPPHKRTAAVTDAAHRVAMTRLAVRGNPAFRVSTLEALAPGPSFTAATVERLTRRGDGECWVIVGPTASMTSGAGTRPSRSSPPHGSRWRAARARGARRPRRGPAAPGA